MYRIELSGCLTFLLITLLIILIIKELWPLIAAFAVIAIIWYYAVMIYRQLTGKSSDLSGRYEPKDGEVYKVCPNCNAKLKVDIMTCPYCKTPLN